MIRDSTTGKFQHMSNWTLQLFEHQYLQLFSQSLRPAPALVV